MYTMSIYFPDNYLEQLLQMCLQLTITVDTKTQEGSSYGYNIRE